MPTVSARQKRAMYAAAEGKSNLGIPRAIGKEFIAADAGAKIAAGIIFVAPDGDVLLVRRAGEEGKDNFVGHWALPGGGAEDGETPEEAADREAIEELGGTAPAGTKRLLDRKITPNGMVFHTFAQPVETKFTPRLNAEHSAFGWFPLDKLPGEGNDVAPEPMHPAVKAVLGENLGIAEDMEPDDWTALRENFAKWTREEEAEPEHGAEDDQPQLATTGNTGIPLAAWNQKRKAVKKAKVLFARDAICRACGGSGCVKCGGSGVSPLTKAPMKPGLGGAMDSMFAALAKDSRKEPEHTLLVRYDGDFRFNSFIAYLRKLGSQGSSRSIGDLDNPDGGEPEHFFWDGDGADKIWDAEIDGEQLAFDRAIVAGVEREGWAFDRAPESVRQFDEDGRLHVEVSNISKAMVCDYLGKEIPKYRELGLDPDRIYKLLRDPAELKKAAHTFNNMPLLDEHVGVNVDNHRPEHVIGSTGTDAVYEHPYLKNSMVVWAARGIKAVESEAKKQLSSAYRYRADMTPGMYEGIPYHGVMRYLRGNHLAIVADGRCGETVAVGDSSIELQWASLELALADFSGP